MTDEEDEQHAIELVFGPAKMDGKKACEDFIKHLTDIDVVIEPQFEDYAEFGNTYIAVWHEAFMEVWMPWMANKLKGGNGTS